MTQTMTFTATLSDAVKPAVTASEGRPDPTAARQENEARETARKERLAAFIEKQWEIYKTASGVCDALKALEMMTRTGATEALPLDEQGRCGLEFLFGLLSEKLFWGAVDPMLSRDELKELLGLPEETRGGE